MLYSQNNYPAPDLSCYLLTENDSLFAICLSTYGIGRKAVATGNTNTPPGKHKIEVDDKYVMFNGMEHIPKVISFKNTDMEVIVAVKTERGCRKYYVLSDKLSIQYVSNRQYFGVELPDKEPETYGVRTSSEVPDRVEYFHQKAITGGERRKRDKPPSL